MYILRLKVDDNTTYQHYQGENACRGDEEDRGEVGVSDQVAEYGGGYCVDYEGGFHLAFCELVH